LSLNRSIT